MVMSCHQNAEHNHNLLIPNNFCENITKFKYLGITLTHQNSIHDEIVSRLN